jgi:hypothetical protein
VHHMRLIAELSKLKNQLKLVADGETENVSSTSASVPAPSFPPPSLSVSTSELVSESMPPAPPLDDNDGGGGAASIDDEEIIDSGSDEFADVDNVGFGTSALRRALTANSGAALICNICIGPLEGPITIPCGHNYCKKCITQWFVAHDTCPLCKYVVSAAIKRDLRINVSLRDFVEKAYPEIAMARLEAEKEKARLEAEQREKARLEAEQREMLEGESQRESFLALIARVRDGTAEAKSVAAAELSQLAAVGTDNQVLIASLGGISALIALIRNGSPEGKGNAANALCNIALNTDNQVLIAREGGIPPPDRPCARWVSGGEGECCCCP